MNSDFDFDEYWGVQLVDVHFESKKMAVSFELFWTLNSIKKRAVLRFESVSRFELFGEKIYESEVVELISMEGKRVDAGWDIGGELSNYDFRIVCGDVREMSVSI